MTGEASSVARGGGRFNGASTAIKIGTRTDKDASLDDKLFDTNSE